VWTHADIAAGKVAELQHGVVHRETLIGAGLTRAMIDRRVDRGQLKRRLPSVYTFGGSPPTDEQTLVVHAFSAGADGAVSHDSAAFLWGLIRRRPKGTHVVVRRWHREHRTECTVHESLDLGSADRVALNGVPVTTAARTVVDLGATSPWLVERALGEGLRMDLFNVAEVKGFVTRVARKGRRGVGVIRPYLEMHGAVRGRTESVLEDRFLKILFERGIRLPVAQFEVRDDRGVVVCRADFSYPELRLLIEVDGRSYHSDTIAFQRDRDKQNRTQELGWQTLRFTWDDVSRRPEHVAATMSSFLRN
jgi:very-short-patch-repair endonuclease